MKYRTYATATDNVHGQFLQSAFMQQQPWVYSQLARIYFWGVRPGSATHCNRASALAPWVLLVLVFGGHFLEAGVVRRLLEGWVPPPLECNTYSFPFRTCLG